jgi:hypothetical protein
MTKGVPARVPRGKKPHRLWEGMHNHLLIRMKRQLGSIGAKVDRPNVRIRSGHHRTMVPTSRPGAVTHKYIG